MSSGDAVRATRAAYDRVASDDARLLPDMGVEAPVDRALLSAFVEMTQAAGSGLAVEVGCGSGRVTAHLADAGLRIVGLDLSPGMATVAKTARPDLGFAVAHAGELPIASGALNGLVAWYSLIDLPTGALVDVAPSSRASRDQAHRSSSGSRAATASEWSGPPRTVTTSR